MIKPFSKQHKLFTFIIDKTSLTAIGSTGFPKISFKTSKSSFCIVVTSPSLNTELKRPARPAICSACDVEIVSSSFSPFSFTLGFTRELKMILLILLKEVQYHYQSLESKSLRTTDLIFRVYKKVGENHEKLKYKTCFIYINSKYN